MDISYDYYKAFYYVAKYGNISKAAEAMEKSQPNVTKVLNKLEDQLGCKLFVRSPRGTRLTPEGEKLYAHVEVAVEHLQVGEREIASDRSLHSGTVSIAASEIALRCHMLPVLERYRLLYPNVRIRLANFTIYQAIEAVKNNLADFAVVTAPAPDAVPKSLKMREISHIQEIFVCGESFRSLRYKTITYAELMELPLICLNAQTYTYQFLTRFFEEQGVTLRPDIEVTTADQILPLVKSNLGIGIVPEKFVEQETGKPGGFWMDAESALLCRPENITLSEMDDRTSYSEIGGIYRLTLEKPLPQRAICLIKRIDIPLSVAARELEQMLIG
ncbi:MAG: LysR family transcriptional regulator [Lachnospiraceae bacterium]|nr:LysR family transcriptional regulator [Lachnospiraceae bacterium]